MSDDTNGFYKNGRLMNVRLAGQCSVCKEWHEIRTHLVDSFGFVKLNDARWWFVETGIRQCPGCRVLLLIHPNCRTEWSSQSASEVTMEIFRRD